MKTQRSQYSQLSSSQSFHHFKILQDHFTKLEQRVHKIYKTQKLFQKNYEIKNQDYKANHEVLRKNILQSNLKIKKLEQSLNLKNTDNKNQIDKYTEIRKQIRNMMKTIEGQFDRKLQQLKIEIKKQFKSDSRERSTTRRKEQQTDKNDKIDKQQVLVLKDSLKKVNKQIISIKEQVQETKLILQKCFSQSFTQQKIDQLQQKFTANLQEGINSIHDIIKKYINDQSNITTQLKDIYHKINQLEKLRKQLEKPFNQNNKYKKQQRTTFFGEQNEEISGKTIPSNFYKQEYQNLTENQSQQKLNRNSSTNRISNVKEQKINYSSKKISDLKQKLKQFQLINNKYQKEKQEYQQQIQTNFKKQFNNVQPKKLNQQKNNDKHNYVQKNEIGTNQNQNVIDQLKQFKYVLENTDSEIDISNTINNEIIKIKQNNLLDKKYRKLEKIYENFN